VPTVSVARRCAQVRVVWDRIAPYRRESPRPAGGGRSKRHINTARGRDVAQKCGAASSPRKAKEPLPEAAREKLVEIVARLREAHDHFERTCEPRTIEAAERRKALRTTREQTFVDAQRALEDIVEIDLLWELERLPFAQKVAQLEAFVRRDGVRESEQPLARRRAMSSAALFLGAGIVLSTAQWVVIERSSLPQPPLTIIGAAQPRHPHSRSSSAASEQSHRLEEGGNNPLAPLQKSR